MSPKNLLLVVLLIACSSGCAQQVVSAQAQPPANEEEINFLSIAGDDSVTQADRRLKRFLENAAGKSFSPQTMQYGGVIRALAEHESDSSPGYLARITPYAYVAAEMLGANLEILAVYKSVAAQSTTYFSYFVVRKDALMEKTNWKPENGDPVLEDVTKYLRSFKSEPPRFIYHDRFSTSSYFLPSLYFRANNMFAMDKSLNTVLTPIRVSQISSTSSSELVEQIVARKADLAAVWSGTMKKFADNRDLLFIKIPAELPNDFLVASGIKKPTHDLIVAAIDRDPAANRPCTSLEPELFQSSRSNRPARVRCQTIGGAPKDDFDAWYRWDSNDSDEIDAAREALATLRQDARQQLTPVVVRVRGPLGLDEGGDSLMAGYVSAAREAVRLSGTEFVLEDKDLHRHPDMTWRLESTHDGALKLTSELDATFKEPNEVFYISFLSASDLPQRIADLVRSRLRRIRYVWPYETKYPAVLRDLDFTPDRRARVQKISWMNPKRNEYEEDTSFEARIDGIDFSKFQLSNERGFATNVDGSFSFDPMSNVAYRVVIAREPQASWIWVALPYTFIAMFGLACIGLVVDLRRHQPAPKGLRQTYERIVEDYHRPWRGQELEEGAVLWSDSARMDETIARIKSAGSFVDLVRQGGVDFDLGPIPVRFSLLMKLFRLVHKGTQLPTDLADGQRGAAALDAVIQYLVCRKRISHFVGFPENAAATGPSQACPMEWDALDDIASRHFQQLGISDKRVGTTLGGHNGPLVSVVSSHFQAVLKRAKHDASLFLQTWTVLEPDTQWRLVYEADLQAPLILRDQDGSSKRVSRVRLEVGPDTSARLFAPADGKLRAWVFGKIHDWTVDGDVLMLTLRPIAVMRDYAYQH